MSISMCTPSPSLTSSLTHTWLSCIQRNSRRILCSLSSIQSSMRSWSIEFHGKLIGKRSTLWPQNVLCSTSTSWILSQTISRDSSTSRSSTSSWESPFSIWLRRRTVSISCLKWTWMSSSRTLSSLRSSIWYTKESTQLTLRPQILVRPSNASFWWELPTSSQLMIGFGSI